MTHLVKIKGLKGKQNKKKWAKNIDVSQLLQAQQQEHDEQIRLLHQQPLIVQDDKQIREPLDPDRFKNRIPAAQKVQYDNRISREFALDKIEDVWGSQPIQKKTTKQFYKPTEVPAVIAPQSGHSYNPRPEDIQNLIDRVIDYQTSKPVEIRVRPKKQLPEIKVRVRNPKKRAALNQIKKHKEEKEFRQQMHNFKKIKQQVEEREQRIAQRIKQKHIKKQKLDEQARAGRVRIGKKLGGKKVYRFRQYLPEGETEAKVSRLAINEELTRERFDSIFRRGIFEPRTIKIHANKTKNIKVKEKGLIQ